MATDLTDLARRLRAHVAGLPVPAGDVEAVLARARRPRPVRANLVPALAALAVLLVVSVVGIGPGLVGAGGQQAGAGPASLPRTVARYSYLTGSVSASPPGPVIMLYQQGYGVELFDFPQALVLGAYDDVYRRVDAAEHRSGSVDQGDPAPMLLSPDGTKVAIGSNAEAADLVVLDLLDGDTVAIATRARGSVRPLAWAPDGSAVVAQEIEGEASPHGTEPPTGQLVRVDLTGRTVHRFAGLAEVSMAAYAPDGRELAVQQGGSVHVVDPATGERRRTLDTGDLPLTSAAAWSPDGRLLAVGPAVDVAASASGLQTVRPGLGFVDPRAQDDPSDVDRGLPPPAAGIGEPVLGWTSDTTVLIRDDSTRSRIVELDVYSGRRTTLTDVDTGPGDNYQLGRTQFATALLPELRTRDAGWADRGIWPTWALVITAVLLGVPALLVVRRIRRR